MQSINVLVSFLSLVRLNGNKIDAKSYPQLDSDGLGETHFTNESGIRYLLNRFKDKKETINGYVFMLSESVRHVKVSEKVPGFNITHFEYVVRRLKTITQIETNVLQDTYIRTVDYHEEARKDISVNSVLGAIQAVLHFQQQYRNTNGTLPMVKLYLDLSGGPRDANMLLLIISRILEYYKDISVENAVYSNLINNGSVGQVQEITGAYHLLDLVAGVYEFNQSGSVNALDRYFNLLHNKGKNLILNNLIDAMRFFSECILLCRVGVFIESIKKLDSAIDDFEKFMLLHNLDSEINVSSKLLETLIPTIRDKYEMLFNAVSGNKIDAIKLFRWCYENDCLQQAITLITEMAPDVFISENEKDGIMNIVAEEKEKLFKDYDKFRQKNPNYTFSGWLFSNYEQLPRGTYKVKNAKDSFNSCLFNDILTSVIGKNLFSEDLEKRLLNRKNKLQEATRYTIEVDWRNLENSIKQFISYCRNSDMNRPGALSINGSDGIIIQNFSKEHCFAELSLKEFFKEYSLGKIKQYKDIDAFEFSGVKMKPLPGTYGTIAYMIDCGIIQSKFETNSLRKLLRLYYEIKEERNSINHAHKDTPQITFKDLKIKMKRFVTLLDYMRNKVQCLERI